MPQFQYLVRTKKGRKQTGKISAISKREAYSKLRNKEMRVLEVKEVPETLLTKEITFGSHLKLRDFVVYLRQFSTLLKAGVTIVDATSILRNQTESKTLQRALETIEDDLRAGRTLSSAYAVHKKMFSRMFISMVKAGESTGQLDVTLENMANYFEKQLRTRQKIQSAMAYPITVGIIAIAVVIFLLVQVVPTFVKMFQDNNAKLPWLTQMVVASSGWMQHYWWVLLCIVIFLYMNFMLINRNKRSKYYVDYAILKLPLLGKMSQKAVIARMTRTLSSLVVGAVPILQSLTIVEDVVDNEVISRAIRKSREALQNGKPLSDPMKNHWVFPALVSNMIAIGEETGALDSMLEKVADFYEAEVEAATDRFKAVIEPAMVVLLSIIVGTIVLAIMIPLFTIYQNIH
ncbi:type II secretion system F family protein [Ectobacillus polymachus]|uniref:type II secretion system F family protein n=1 Tax=Ectobacillus polymachus TaxID=1508806 RepID=UPI003A89DD2D